MEEKLSLSGLTAEEIWENLYNKELNNKKNILEYIEICRILIKEKAEIYQIESTYNFIYNNINKMSTQVKPNTIMYLQNKLKAQLGKYVTVKEPKEENSFISFFKEAYPEGNRRKDFTWVLINVNNIADEQIWNTLVYINRGILNGEIRLTSEEKEDIVYVINILVKRNNLKYINQVKSFSSLLNILNIKIIEHKDKFKVNKNNL